MSKLLERRHAVRKGGRGRDAGAGLGHPPADGQSALTVGARAEFTLFDLVDSELRVFDSLRRRSASQPPLRAALCGHGHATSVAANRYQPQHVECPRPQPRLQLPLKPCDRITETDRISREQSGPANDQGPSPARPTNGLQPSASTCRPAPPPIANFVTHVQEGNILYLSGQGPREADGHLHAGKVGARRRRRKRL